MSKEESMDDDEYVTSWRHNQYEFENAMNSHIRQYMESSGYRQEFHDVCDRAARDRAWIFTQVPLQPEDWDDDDESIRSRDQEEFHHAILASVLPAGVGFKPRQLTLYFNNMGSAVYTGYADMDLGDMEARSVISGNETHRMLSLRLLSRSDVAYTRERLKSLLKQEETQSEAKAYHVSTKRHLLQYNKQQQCKHDQKRKAYRVPQKGPRRQ